MPEKNHVHKERTLFGIQYVREYGEIVAKQEIWIWFNAGTSIVSNTVSDTHYIVCAAIVTHAEKCVAVLILYLELYYSVYYSSVKK